MSSNGNNFINTFSKQGKQKQGACTECHKSKNKCVYPPSELNDPTKRPVCNRCMRLKKECIPHISRQGKRKHRSSEGTENSKDGNEDDGFLHRNSRKKENTIENSKARGIIGNVIGGMIEQFNGRSINSKSDDRPNKEELLRLQSMQNLQKSSLNLQLTNGILAAQNRVSNTQRLAAASSLPSGSVSDAGNSQSSTILPVANSVQSTQNLQKSPMNLLSANGILATQNRILNMQQNPAASSLRHDTASDSGNSQSSNLNAEARSIKLLVDHFMSSRSNNITNNNPSSVDSQLSDLLRTIERDRQSSALSVNSIASNEQSSGGPLQHVLNSAVSSMGDFDGSDSNNKAHEFKNTIKAANLNLNARLEGSCNDNESVANKSVPSSTPEMFSGVLRHGLFQNPKENIVAASIDGVSNSGTTVQATNVLNIERPTDGLLRSNSQSSHHTRASLPSRMSELSGATGMGEANVRIQQRLHALQPVQPMQSGPSEIGHDAQMSTNALLLLAQTSNPGSSNSVNESNLEGIPGAGNLLERNISGTFRDASSESAAIQGPVLRSGTRNKFSQSLGHGSVACSEPCNIITESGRKEIRDIQLDLNKVEIIQGVSPADDEELSIDNAASPIPPPLQKDGPNQECTTVDDICEQDAMRRSSSKLSLAPENEIGMHFARACAKHSGKQLTSLKHHYGMQCLIREWISMALARRSFNLLGKASGLADRCGIHMDRILCGVAEEGSSEKEGKSRNQKLNRSGTSKNIGGRMHYLLSLLLEPHSNLSPSLKERHMLIPRLPPAFLSLVGCQSCPTFQPQDIRNRWIFIRETSCGISRFYCSPAFERNILCWKLVSEIFENNLADIFSLILAKGDFRRILACVAHQLSLHSVEGMPPRPVHAPNITVRLLGKNWGQLGTDHGDSSGITTIAKKLVEESKNDSAMTVEMDSLFVMLPEMDKTTYYLEFFHHSLESGNAGFCDEVEEQRFKKDEITNHNPSTTHWRKAMASRESSREENKGSAFAPNTHGTPDTRSANGSTTSNRGRSTPMSTSYQPPNLGEFVDPELWVGIDDVLASGDIDDLITALMD